MSPRFVFPFLALLTFAPPVSAQRRDSSAQLPTVETHLPSPAQFGSVTLPARTYRVSLTAQGLLFIDPQTLVWIATIPTTEADASERAAAPAMDVTDAGAELKLVMKYETHTYTSIGKKVDATTAAANSPVALKNLGDAELPASTDPVTPLDFVKAALPRLEVSLVQQCADRATKARWGTDNAQFEKCVCPQVAKWRVPKNDTAARVQRPLAKGHNGYSFTADTTGKPQNCRVWAGTAPPADDTVAWKPATAASAKAATPEKKKP